VRVGIKRYRGQSVLRPLAADLVELAEAG